MNPEPETTLFIEHVHPRLRLDEAGLEKRIRTVVAAEGFEIAYLGVILADHDTVLALNRDYLAHDYLTDVLSFSLGDTDEAIVDGEVYVDLDTAAERHTEFGVSFEHEVHRYVIHGLLHLLGYEDATPDQQAAMRALEDRYLDAAG